MKITNKEFEKALANWVRSLAAWRGFRLVKHKGRFTLIDSTTGMFAFSREWPLDQIEEWLRKDMDAEFEARYPGVRAATKDFSLDS